MENLMFALNAVAPMFFVMVLGYAFKNLKLCSEGFLSGMNGFVFKIALPVALFKDLTEEDFYAVWDLKFVLFCFFVTAICIVAAVILAHIVCGRDMVGEFAQATYRSSAAILGIAFLENLYGSAGMVPLMMAAAVPLYNVTAVIILSVFKPGGGRMTKDRALNTARNIATNPIILAIAVGLIWSLLKIPQPTMFKTTIKYVANLSSPLGLMAVGASFSFKAAFAEIRPALIATFFKLVVWCAVFLPLAVKLGFTHDKLVAILAMLGTSTTVSSYVMAKNMGHEGTLSASIVMLTTMFSSFTLTAWVYILRTMGLA